MEYRVNFAEKVNFEKNDYIQIYYGRNSLGVDFFYYIRCNIEGYKKMKEDYLNKIVTNPESYGEIIYKDQLSEPDEKAKTFLANWLKNNS